MEIAIYHGILSIKVRLIVAILLIQLFLIQKLNEKDAILAERLQTDLDYLVGFPDEVTICSNIY